MEERNKLNSFFGVMFYGIVVPFFSYASETVSVSSDYGKIVSSLLVVPALDCIGVYPVAIWFVSRQSEFAVFGASIDELRLAHFLFLRRI